MTDNQNCDIIKQYTAAGEFAKYYSRVVLKCKFYNCLKYYSVKGMFSLSDRKEIILACKEGMKNLTDELEQLKTVRRPAVSEKIKIARGFGDLSENAEYDEAKKEQAEVEERILVLEDILKYARVISDDEKQEGVVGLGSKVELLDIEFDETFEYSIVSTIEADPDNDKISIESPVGKSLIGKKANDIVKVEIPHGVVEYKILSVSFIDN